MADWFEVRESLGEPGQGGFACRIAGIPLVAPTTLPALEAFRLRPREPAPDIPAPLPVPVGDGGARTARGELGGAPRDVGIQPDGAAWALDLGEVGRFRVDADRVRGPDLGPVASPLFLEALFGPALLFLLALRGRFGLHAAAIRRGADGVWLLLGDSGAGKSTLARAAAGADGWAPVGDDIVVVSGDGSRFDAWPRFPQLKLPPDGQYGASCPECLPVAGFCVLERLAPDASPTVVPLPPRESALALVRQGVASRLYPPTLLAAQFRELMGAAGRLPALRLGVPWRRDAVGAALATLGQAI